MFSYIFEHEVVEGLLLENFWWGCVAGFSKPLPYFRPNYVPYPFSDLVSTIHTCFQTTSNLYPISDQNGSTTIYPWVPHIHTVHVHPPTPHTPPMGIIDSISHTILKMTILVNCLSYFIILYSPTSSILLRKYEKGSDSLLATFCQLVFPSLISYHVLY